MGWFQSARRRPPAISLTDRIPILVDPDGVRLDGFVTISQLVALLNAEGVIEAPSGAVTVEHVSTSGGVVECANDTGVLVMAASPPEPGPWAPNTAYNLYNPITQVAEDGAYWYPTTEYATTGANEPDFGSPFSSELYSDGEVSYWGKKFADVTVIDEWEPLTAYAANTILRTGHGLFVTEAGHTSGESEPDWASFVFDPWGDTTGGPDDGDGTWRGGGQEVVWAPNTPVRTLSLYNGIGFHVHFGGGHAWQPDASFATAAMSGAVEPADWSGDRVEDGIIVWLREESPTGDVEITDIDTDMPDGRVLLLVATGTPPVLRSTNVDGNFLTAAWDRRLMWGAHVVAVDGTWVLMGHTEV